MHFWIIFFCLVGGAGGVVAAASVLVLREELRKSLLPLLLAMQRAPSWALLFSGCFQRVWSGRLRWLFQRPSWPGFYSD